MTTWALLILLLTTALLVVVSTERCSGINATTYLRSEATRLMEFSTKVLKDVTLNTCASACSTLLEMKDCVSFDYDAANLECSLHSEDGQPFGASVLSKTNTSISFFQQICLQKEFLCNAPYAFERYPQSVLIGHVMKVTTVDGLSDCLSKCLRSSDFRCKSAIYYYETGECIMNRDSKFFFGHLFKTGIQDTLVDYFENNCLDVSCTDTQTLHWVRTEDFAIDDAKDVVVESSDAQQCNAICVENKVGEERFPCKAFAFSNAKQECHLTAESSYVGHKAAKNFDLAPLSGGEYFEKYCLNTNLQCLDASFELVPNRKMTSNYKILTFPSQHDCLTECMKEGARCASLTYYFESNECQLSDISQFSRPDQFVVANFTDYFDKICDPADPKPVSSEVADTEPNKESVEDTKPNNTVAQGATNFQAVTKIPEPVNNDIDEEEKRDEAAVSQVRSEEIPSVSTEVEGTVIDDADEFNKEVENGDTDEETPIKGRLSTECRMSGITVAIHFGSTTSGAIYIKDHFATCKQQFANSTYAELHIPFPNSDESNPRCPGSETEPAKWSFNIVVQRNEMKTSLVTTRDKTFQVSCDYSNVVDKTTPPTFEGDLKSEKIGMQILRNGVPVTTVPLGAEVTLKWTVLNKKDQLGFFINECIAERVGGVSPEPEPLKIIYQGCPEEKVRNRLLSNPVVQEDDGFSTKMKVFRFDGSRRVRIKCSVDVCVQRCPAVICDDLPTGSESFGRKKRDARDLQRRAGTTDGRERRRRRRDVVVGMLTITEDEKKERPRPEFSTARDAEFCVQKSHAELAAVVVTLFLVVQFAVLVTCLRRCSRSFSDAQSVVSGSDTSTFSFSPSSSRLNVHCSSPRLPPHMDHFGRIRRVS